MPGATGELVKAAAAMRGRYELAVAELDLVESRLAAQDGYGLAREALERAEAARRLAPAAAERCRAVQREKAELVARVQRLIVSNALAVRRLQAAHGGEPLDAGAVDALVGASAGWSTAGREASPVGVLVRAGFGSGGDE